jgi:hypothetical protein
MEGVRKAMKARRAVGRKEAMESRRRTTWRSVPKPAYVYISITSHTIFHHISSKATVKPKA